MSGIEADVGLGLYYRQYWIFRPILISAFETIKSHNLTLFFFFLHKQTILISDLFSFFLFCFVCFVSEMDTWYWDTFYN